MVGQTTNPNKGSRKFLENFLNCWWRGARSKSLARTDLEKGIVEKGKFRESLISKELIFEKWSVARLITTKLLRKFLKLPIAIKRPDIMEQDLLYDDAQNASFS